MAVKLLWTRENLKSKPHPYLRDSIANNLLRSVDTKVLVQRQTRGSTKGIRDKWTLTHNHCAKHTVHEDTYISRLHSGVAPPLPLDIQAYNKG